jgi:hypothetical protein
VIKVLQVRDRGQRYPIKRCRELAKRLQITLPADVGSEQVRQSLRFLQIVEAQILREGEPVSGRRFDLRRSTEQWADEE